MANVANNYSKWLSAAGLSPLSGHLRDREQLRKSGLLQVVKSEEAVKMIRAFADAVPITHFYSWTLPPGLPPRWAQSHLELFASKVIPAFRGDLGVSLTARDSGPFIRKSRLFRGKAIDSERRTPCKPFKLITSLPITT